jgi:transposase InsO family protein
MLTDTLQEHGINIGRDRLFDLLEAYGLLVRRRKRKSVYTTNSRHRFNRYPNLVKAMQPLSAGQLWVSDITYIALFEDFAYLSLITDAYSRKIVGYCLYPTLSRQGPLNALTMALTEYDRNIPLMHHSDRGVQYCCDDYTDMLLSNTIAISMTEKGDPYENAIAERVNGILKNEFGLEKTFDSFGVAEETIKQAIDIYNNQRPHASCDYLTPIQAHSMNGLIKRRWKKKQYV